jgi:hypothetical protein
MVNTTVLVAILGYNARKRPARIIIRLLIICSAILAVRSYYVQEMLAVLLLFALPFTIIILLIIGTSVLWDIAMFRLESGIRTLTRPRLGQLISRTAIPQKSALGYRRL